MARKGVLLSILGLLIGVAIGSAVLLAQKALEELLVREIGSEAELACGCSIKYDSLEISLLSRSGRARNVRMFDNTGKRRLAFGLIKARFDISEILSKKVWISVDLMQGRAHGFDDQSVLFRFIDQLTTPNPNPRPDRWRVRLKDLRLLSSELSEALGPFRIVARNSAMTMRRDAADDWDINAEVGELVLIRPERPQQVSAVLGKLRGQITLQDEQILYRALRLSKGESWIDAAGVSHTKQRNRLEGTLSYSVAADDALVGELVAGAVTGRAVLGGRIAAPEVRGGFNLPADGTIVPKAKALQRLTVSKADGTFIMRAGEGSASVTIPSLDASGSGFKLLIARPIIVSDTEISGAGRLVADALDMEGITFSGAELLSEMRGSLDEPNYRHTFSAAQLGSGGIKMTELSADLRQTPDRTVQFNFSTADKALAGRGTLSIGNGDALNCSDCKAELANLVLISGRQHPRLAVSGSLNVEGPLTRAEAAADAVFTLHSPSFADPEGFSGKLTLIQGALDAHIGNRSQTLKAELSGGLAKAMTLRAVADGFSPADLRTGSECSQISAALTYTFMPSTPLTGNGALNLSSASLGCQPYQLTLVKPVASRIENGRLELDSLRLSGKESDFLLAGNASVAGGVDLTMKGDLRLAGLLPIFPSLDDLRGRLSGDIRLHGPWEDPRLHGSAALVDGGFAIESADISASQMSGQIALRGETAIIDGLSGTLNGGQFSIFGDVYPLALERSQLAVEISNVLLVPSDKLSMVISGALELKRGDSGHAAVAGELNIDSGEFTQNIDLTTLLRAITALIFERAPVNRTTAQLPDVELDVKVNASRNLLVVTNWAGAELAADLRVTGNFASPRLEGTISSLSGWFRVKDRRFEVTSGLLRFRPTDSSPQLELVSEANVTTMKGESTLVILEANGPLDAPRTTLTSDRGLSEREILSLLTAGGLDQGRTLSNTVGLSLSNPYWGQEDEQDAPLLRRLLRAFTTVDSLAIEPVLNPRTGTVDPAISVMKELREGIRLEGLTTVGTVSDARGQAVIAITPRLNLVPYAETISTREASAIGIDITQTILAEAPDFLTITVSGSAEIGREELLRGIRLGPNSRVPHAELEKLGAAIERYYIDEGFISTRAFVECQSEFGLCRKMQISVEEGARTRISAVTFSADDPAALLGPAAPEPPEPESPATIAALRRYEKQLIRMLRSEGFIAARISARYEPGSTDEQRILNIDLHGGEPITFSFQGNTLFSAEQFLETINLFERRQPFGNNTINILLENMERLYREQGHLFVSIRYELAAAGVAGARRVYQILVDEGPEVTVAEVRWSGNAGLATEEIRRIVAQRYGEFYDEVFNPEYAIAERLELNVRTLKSVYAEAGYPDAAVTYRIEPAENSDQVIIIYQVDEGAALNVSAISIDGMPGDLPFDPLPSEHAHSIPFVNRYIERLLTLLEDEGYISPAIDTTVDSDEERLLINVTPGPRAVISAIVLQGNSEIKSEVIERNLPFTVGDPWRVEQIDAARRALLRLGLFVAVTLKPADGAVDEEQEALVVHVSERPLNTLEIGSGINSELGFHAFGNATNRELFRDGRSLSLRTDLFYEPSAQEISQGIANLRFSHPYLFDDRVLFNEDLQYLKFEQTSLEYDLDRLSLSSYFSRNWDHDVSASIAHVLLQDNLSSVSEDAKLSDLDDGTLTLSLISMAATFDRRDRPINPSSGYLISAEGSLATRALGSEADYYSMAGKLSVLQPLSSQLRRISFASQLSAATAWTFGDTGELPITQRFYLGGRSTVRGFRENSLGPRGDAGAILGGDLMVMGNFELRYLLAESISTHIFLDGGSVFLRSRDISLGDLRWSTGIGARYLSPIGPIGFDVGHPLDEEEGEPSLRFHFAIGSAF